MNGWKLSTRDVGPHGSTPFWKQSLAKVLLPEATALNEQGFQGEIAHVVSPQGIEFSRLSASAQSISGTCENHTYALWLSIVTKGRFHLEQHNRTMPVHEGDIIFSPIGRDATLALESDFEMLYVKIPRGLIHPRLLNPATLELGSLPISNGVNRVFSDMLLSISKHIQDVDTFLLRPVEIALSEFLVTTLTQQSMLDAFGSSAKLAHYQRICQEIDSRLREPDLNLQGLAQSQHVSPRYIQKLFEAAQTSFGSYVRTRRLERCRCELENPKYAHLSISDICFRWGFNDAAHFSRSFRSTFGMTPRECRLQALPQVPAAAALAL